MKFTKEQIATIVTASIDSLVSGNDQLDEQCLHSGLLQLGLIKYEDTDTAYELFGQFEHLLAEEVDNSHFRCETCSWWFEHHEASEDEEGSCEGCD